MIGFVDNDNGFRKACRLRCRVLCLLVYCFCAFLWGMESRAFAAESADLEPIAKARLSGNWKVAREGYREILKDAPELNIRRRAQAGLAAVQIKLAKESSGSEREKLLRDAEELCRQIQLGGVDLWFSSSVVSWCQIMILRGNMAEARATLKEQIPIFKSIEKELREQNLSVSAHSPIAGARMLLGEIYLQDAERATEQEARVKALSKALNEFATVFARYGESEWSTVASEQAEKSKLALARLGKTVQIDLGQYSGTIGKTRLRGVDRIFARGDYAQAYAKYLLNLNKFPASEEGANALWKFAVSAFHMDRPQVVEAASSYLCDRFGSKEAVAGVLRVAKACLDGGDDELAFWNYDLYLARFPQHPRAPQVLLALADLKRQVNDRVEERSYLERVVSDYPTKPAYRKALRRLAWSAYERGEYEFALEPFRKYVAVLDGANRMRAQFALGNANFELGHYADARADFKKLENFAGELQEGASEWIAKSLYRQGDCLLAQGSPSHKKGALESYLRVADLAPASKLAPKAMRMAGEVQLENDDYGAAANTFEKLAENYPDSPEGRNARFTLLSTALDMERFDLAEKTLRNMLQESREYDPEIFVLTGNRFLQAGKFALAEKSFSATLDRGEDAPTQQILYGIARAHFGRDKFADCIASLRELLRRFPNTAHYFEAKFILSKACYKNGNRQEAQEVLGDILGNARDDLLTHRANYELGCVQSEPTEKLASFQRVAILADPNQERMRPLIGRSLLKSVELYIQLGQYAEAVVSADQYLEQFPEGEHLEEIRKLRSEAEGSGGGEISS